MNTKFLLGVIAGAAIGAFLGILYAPNSGTETRRKISDKKDEYTDLVKDKIVGFINNIQSKLEVVKEEVDSLAGEARKEGEMAKETW
jgi:gas vesicle protein